MTKEVELVAEIEKLKQQLNSAKTVITDVSNALNESELASIWHGSLLHRDVTQYLESLTDAEVSHDNR